MESSVDPSSIMENLNVRIARNSKKLTRKIEKAPKMAVIIDTKKYASWTRYSKNMAALIITTWSLKMIKKMSEKRVHEDTDLNMLYQQQSERLSKIVNTSKKRNASINNRRKRNNVTKPITNDST